MRFENEGRTEDIQDRRGMRGPVGVGAGLSLGGVVIVAIASLLTGRNLFAVLGQGSSSGTAGRGVDTTPYTGPRNAAEAEAEKLVRRATTDIQNFWTEALPQMSRGIEYQRTQLVLFADSTR